MRPRECDEAARKAADKCREIIEAHVKTCKDCQRAAIQREVDRQAAHSTGY